VSQKGGELFEYNAESLLVRVRRAQTGKVIEENVYDAGGQRVIQRTSHGEVLFIDGIYEEGKTHVSRHVRLGSLVVATIMTPRANVELIEALPVPGFGSVAALDGLRDSRWIPAGSLALLGLALLLRYRRAWRQRLDGMIAVGAEIQRRPTRATVVLMLLPAVLLPTWQPAYAAAVSETASEKRYYYHSNHLGSVNVVTDDRGKVVERRDYKPYGERFDWTGPNSGPRELLLTFNGHRYDDATGFYYFGARHYDPELGRSLTADTQVPDPMNPKTLHRYAFAGGNPIRFVDPTGHAWWDILIGIFVFIVAIVITAVTFGTAAALITVSFAVLGALVFGALAAAKGLNPMSPAFWESVVAGLVLGAAIGAGLSALPSMFGSTVMIANAAASDLTVFQSTMSAMLVGAMTGAV
jgi:RHS repeat-associated protein